MEAKNMATQLLKSLENMVDPDAPVEQQLAQMRAQMAALAELPNIINEKLESVNKKINQIQSMQESVKKEFSQEQQQVEIRKDNEVQKTQQYYQQQHLKNYQQQSQVTRNVHSKHSTESTEIEPHEGNRRGIQIRVTKPSLTGEELDVVKREELRRSLEDLSKRKSVSPAKEQVPNQAHQRDHAARGKPTPAFGPGPQDRPLYLPGGRRWKMSEYDEDQISETLVGQAEIIKGNAIGVNFKKFEKPPVGLDHLKNSEVYRAVHNLDDEPLRKVANLRPAMAASEIRERVRSMSPASPTIDPR